MIFIAIVLLLATWLGGCGFVARNPNAPMQAGQWEFAMESTNADPTIFIESDLTGPSATGVSTSGLFATRLLKLQTGASIGGLFADCTGVQTSFSVSGNKVTASLSDGTTQLAQANATLAPDGKSLTGTFQLVGTTGLCDSAVTSSGTFMGKIVAPLNGTYSGTMSDGSQLTLQFTQDNSFRITATGTSSAQGVATSLSIGADSTPPPNYNHVIGAELSDPNGLATNVNGTTPFQVYAHLTADAAQLLFALNNGSWSTGTLAKQ
jgi:hypothetical protein